MILDWFTVPSSFQQLFIIIIISFSLKKKKNLKAQEKSCSRRWKMIMISNSALTFHGLMVLGHVNVTDVFFSPRGEVVEWNKGNVLNTGPRIRWCLRTSLNSLSQKTFCFFKHICVWVCIV